MRQCVNLRPPHPLPALRGKRSWMRAGLSPSLGQVVIPVVFAPKVGRFQWVQSAVPCVRAPRHTQRQQSYLAEPRRRLGAPRAPSGPGLAASSVLRPASPSSLSALFEIELCFLPSTRERGNGCFPFHLASAHPLSLARPLSSSRMT